MIHHLRSYASASPNVRVCPWRLNAARGTALPSYPARLYQSTTEGCLGRKLSPAPDRRYSGLSSRSRGWKARAERCKSMLVECTSLIVSCWMAEHRTWKIIIVNSGLLSVAALGRRLNHVVVPLPPIIEDVKIWYECKIWQVTDSSLTSAGYSDLQLASPPGDTISTRWEYLEGLTTC